MHRFVKLQLESKCSSSGFQDTTNFTCLWMVRVGSGAAYRMIFSKRYTFDALRGLTVDVKLAARVAVWDSSDIGIYN